MAYAILGPQGTFSEEAARLYWGDEVDLSVAASIPEVFALVESGKVRGALLPIENSLAGSINLTMESLETRAVNIKGEMSIAIRQHLMANKRYELEEIELLVSQPVVLVQCDRFIKEYLPGVRKEITDSTTGAAAIICSEKKKAACIGNSLACSLYGLEMISSDIQDSNNYTRFIHIEAVASIAQGDKSSLIFSLPDNPGALYRALEVFARRNVNLSKIESRPGRCRTGTFSFYVEADNPANADLEEVLAELNKHCCYVKFLGSYNMKNINS